MYLTFEENRLTAFKNRALRTVSEPTAKKCHQDRKVIMKRLIIYYSLTYTIGMIRARRMRWPGKWHVCEKESKTKCTHACGAQT